jgi:hypothetical protein
VRSASHHGGIRPPVSGPLASVLEPMVRMAPFVPFVAPNAIKRAASNRDRSKSADMQTNQTALTCVRHSQKTGV